MPSSAACTRPFRDTQFPPRAGAARDPAFTHPDGSRRNATENRNRPLEHLRLKQLWPYGLAGASILP
jgi:hypothetical protein